MVEVKYKSLFKIPMFFYSIIPLFVFAGVPFWGILKAFFDMYNVGMNIESVKFFFLCVLMLVIFGVVTFSFIPNFKLVFDDSGITMKRKVELFSITLFDNVLQFRWNEITELDVVPVRGLTFYKSVNGSLRMASLNCFLTNKKEAFEFAVTKLPSYKISKEARLKLKKKYGIIVE